jgi:hypothetical protein
MALAGPVTARRRRPSRLAGVAVLSVAGTVAAVFFLLPLAVEGLLRLLDFTLNACVWLAASFSNGADGWTILSAIARAAVELLLSTRALTVVSSLVLVGAAALYGLQRLLGSEGESSR